MRSSMLSRALLSSSMTPHEYIQQIRDALKGLNEHSQSNAAIWTAIHDLEMDLHEVEKAFDQEVMKE